jgi:hypothetical protein
LNFAANVGGRNSRLPPEAAVAGSLAPNRRTRPFSDIQAGDRMAGAGRNRNVRIGCPTATSRRSPLQIVDGG